MQRHGIVHDGLIAYCAAKAGSEMFAEARIDPRCVKDKGKKVDRANLTVDTTRGGSELWVKANNLES